MTNQVCGNTDKLCISVMTRTGSEDGTNVSIDVIKLFATVPYDPVLSSGLGFIGFNDLIMEVNHEQAWIGS